MIGDARRYDYTAIGTVVNVASRLCDEASHGEVPLTQRVVAEFGDLAQVTGLGEIEIKGVSRPVDVYRLTSI